MSASVLEPYDAQMIDYSTDLDVPMQTTAPSPKAWPHPEAAMEDDIIDTHPIVDATPSRQEEDVEIELEPYFEEPVEYEMADDYTANDESPDVEVYDAPQDSDPVAGESFAFPRSPGPSHSEVPPATAEKSGPFPQHPVVMIHENVFPDASSLPKPSPYAPSPHAATEPAAHHPAGETSELPIVFEPNTDSLAHSPGCDVSGVLPAAEAAAVNGELDGPNVEEDTKSRAASAEADQNGVASAEQPLAAEHHVLDLASHEEGEEAGRQPDSSGLDIVDFTHLEPPADGLTTLPTSEACHENRDVHEEDLDPHQVSEGVFIEPPPPVLLEISSSSGQPECCLFNAPAASGRVTPHGHDSSSQPSSRFDVLLAHRPTLYYERLSDVFEALREEERIQRLAEFAEGEMILDAYDLQLVVSEDNIYAREVTLHDLNILHDGTDFTGPLRIRLRFNMPRFIGRYHLLRDQISRLNLAEDGEEVYSQGGPNYEDVHEGSYQEDTSDKQGQEEVGQLEAENGDEPSAQVATADQLQKIW
ncbi:hypothetical protein DENSPDRAFT_390375 [Dentipellis sp. KUC8613]|nr:hypothetical protein DENSPDRAFT_390375 [Dentipellis sp. KUC8613]